MVFCSYGRAGLHRSDNGGSGAFPGGLREAQGGWRRRPREAGGGGTGGRLRGGGRLKRGEAQGAGSLHRSDNRPILIAR